MVLENEKIDYLNCEIALLTAIKKENKELSLNIMRYIRDNYGRVFSKTFLKNAYIGLFKVKKETALKRINKMGFIYGDGLKTFREIVKYPKKVDIVYYKVLPYNSLKGCCFDGKRAIFQTYSKETKSFEDIANIKNGLGVVCEYDFAKSKTYYFEKPTRKNKTFKFVNLN